MDNTIKGILTSCITGERSVVDLEYEIKIEDISDETNNKLGSKRIFRLINGVTGYESFYIDHDLANVKRMCLNGWRACVGTKGSWNELFIPAEEMKKIDWEVKKW